MPFITDANGEFRDTELLALYPSPYVLENGLAQRELPVLYRPLLEAVLLHSSI